MELLSPEAAAAQLRLDTAGGPDACWPPAPTPRRRAGGIARNGYGKCGLRLPDGRRETLVLRAALRLCVGPPPFPKAEAAHALGCVRACGNPRHGRWATSAENHADQRRAGTHPAGERNGRAKLTAAAVAAFRRGELSRLPVSDRQQRDIAAGRAWPGVG